jgi:hypothetical protein
MAKKDVLFYLSSSKTLLASVVPDQGYSFAEACTFLGMGESAQRWWVQQLAEEHDGVTPKGSKADSRTAPHTGAGSPL